MKNRPGIIVLAFVLLGLFVGWSYWQWQLAQAEAYFAAEQLQECRRLGQTIFRLRQKPAKFEDTLRSNDALAKLVESSAQQSDVDRQLIAEISPAEPRRLGDTSYKEQLTRVQLRDVTLRQLIRFLLAVPASDPAVQIDTVSLRAPIQADPGSTQPPAGELWNAELTLNSRFYAPVVAGSRK